MFAYETVLPRLRGKRTFYPTDGTNKLSFWKAVWHFLSKPWSSIPGNLSLGKKDVFKDFKPKIGHG